MILVGTLLILLTASLLAWLSERWGPQWPRWITLGALSASLLPYLSMWSSSFPALTLPPNHLWSSEFAWAWIPRFGIQIHLSLDSLSLLLIGLTLFLGLTAVIASWTEITRQIGFFHANLLWVLVGVLGVFTTRDLILFFVFWEIMLVPMYFMINVWGHEHREYAAVKFFLFTQAGGLLMLLSILALGLTHSRQFGMVSFDYSDLLAMDLPPSLQWWLFLGFLAAFAVKLPAVPFHTWLPDAHTEAPTGGSIILAGLLLKTGAYGLLRFAIPLFPEASLSVTPYMMGLGVIGILYGAFLAFAQTDFKRLVAYSSIAHLGFVLLGIFVGNLQALQGAVILMLAHGISTGALFMLAGGLQERLQTRDLNRMGGLWGAVPRLAGFTMFFALASLGLPGLANFIGEFLILLGSYRLNIPLAVLATLGVVGAAIYSLTLIQRAFYGHTKHSWNIPDLAPRYLVTLALMGLLQVWGGLYPQPIIQSVRPVLVQLHSRVTHARGVTSEEIPPRHVEISRIAHSTFP